MVSTANPLAAGFSFARRVSKPLDPRPRLVAPRSFCKRGEATWRAARSKLSAETPCCATRTDQYHCQDKAQESSPAATFARLVRKKLLPNPRWQCHSSLLIPELNAGLAGPWAARSWQLRLIARPGTCADSCRCRSGPLACLQDADRAGLAANQKF